MTSTPKTSPCAVFQPLPAVIYHAEGSKRAKSQPLARKQPPSGATAAQKAGLRDKWAKARAKRYRATHVEIETARQTRWRAQHREHVNALARARYAKGKEGGA